MQHLTPRDQVVLSLLDQHRTLTTEQIAAIAFAKTTDLVSSVTSTSSSGARRAGRRPASGGPSAARTRLYRLRRAGWVDCFTPARPVRSGLSGRAGAGTHWVLAQAGARWAANLAERTPPTPRELRDRNEATAASSQLTHMDGQNGFFTALLTAAAHYRARGINARLARWWSPARTAEGFGGRIRPDGHGVWIQQDPDPNLCHPEDHPHREEGGLPREPQQVGFLLEWDTGSETLGRLLAKVETYRRLRADGNAPDYPILFVLPSLARETNLHAALVERAVPTRTLTSPVARPGWDGRHDGLVIATTHRAAIAGQPDGPAGPVWRLAGNGRRRHRLIELPSTHGEAGPSDPGAPLPAQDPLALLNPEPNSGDS